MLHEEHTPMCNYASDIGYFLRDFRNDTLHMWAVCACCGVRAFTDKVRIYLHYYYFVNRLQNTPALTIHSLTRAFIFQGIPKRVCSPRNEGG